MTSDEYQLKLSNAIQLFENSSPKELPSRFEFEIERQHHNDANYNLIQRLKNILIRRGYNTYESWNTEYDTKRFTFYLPPGASPY